MEYSPRRGFTLLELLIVITILAILTLVVILFINPVEILKKSRDVQRMSDLRTMKTAIALYL
ncbi:prepilin-type N-terminal cleavage/methylation domain-containing protein, partial [Candidatus Azambacteria bacterium]|nr:prepilin-type N-terminal cleavage/methylation domain-containing protein [Candidatus Azambacteria bacterium]